MSNIKESAEAYVPQTTKNITDLEKVPVEIEMNEKTFSEGTKDEFTINVIEVDGEEYRVPTSVLKQLKEQLKAKPKLTYFKVTKTGEGMKTEYTVIVLE